MKKLLPILILVIAAASTALLVILKPAPTETAPERPIATVEVITAQPQTVTLTINSQGTLLPRTESDISAEVTGRIIEVSDAFRSGGYIREGDVLLRIDPADYLAAVTAQAAELANAKLILAQEKAQAEQAAADWETLGEGEASDLTLRKPQLAQANARIAAAEAALKRAERDLDRTEIIAPFDGRVLDTMVDLGQYVVGNPASPIARIFATDRAEVRLPISTREAELLETRDRRQRLVTLRKAKQADSPEWIARFARVEATLNPKSRLLYVVAELDNPFAPKSPDQPPLRRGQFLEATIEGRSLSDAYVLPSYALRGSDTVYILNENATLETRQVGILKSDAEEVIITEGLEPGDQVAVSPIAYFAENMPVEVVAE